jgi:hypothetical protein
MGIGVVLLIMLMARARFIAYHFYSHKNKPFQFHYFNVCLLYNIPTSFNNEPLSHCRQSAVYCYSVCSEAMYNKTWGTSNLIIDLCRLLQDEDETPPDCYPSIVNPTCMRT